jgi:hypothetical protein
MRHAVRSNAVTAAGRAAPTRAEPPFAGARQPDPNGAASGSGVDREFFTWFGAVLTLSLAFWVLLGLAGKALLGL